MKKQEQVKPIVLTAKQIKDQGSKLSDLLPRIELLEQLCDASLLVARSNLGEELIQHQMKSALNAILDYSQQLYNEVDAVAFKLISCDDENELAAYLGRAKD